MFFISNYEGGIYMYQEWFKEYERIINGNDKDKQSK